MKLERFLRGLVPVSGFADDLEVGIRLDQRPKTLADSEMVVGDKNALWHVGKSRFSPLHGHRTGGGRSMYVACRESRHWCIVRPSANQGSCWSSRILPSDRASRRSSAWSGGTTSDGSPVSPTPSEWPARGRPTPRWSTPP